MIDLPSIADIAGISGKARGYHNKAMNSLEYCGSCPWCSCRDAFHCYPDMNYVENVGYLGYFLCMDSSRGGRNGCGKSGNIIDLTMYLDGLNYWQACERLGINPHILRANKKTRLSQPVETFSTTRALSLAERSETWQINAFNLARKFYPQMTDEVRDYLHSRSITDALIAEYAYGLYDHYKLRRRSVWGDTGSREMVITRGIVIPWLDEQKNVLCVRIRRLPWDESEEAKKYYRINKDGSIGRYKALYGSCSSTFYQGHKITEGASVALFEGEFTCVVAQESVKGSGIVCVASGSTSWGRNDANLRMLAACEKVLICFDNDDNQAGDKSAEWWTDRLENAKRWRPVFGDANDMAIDGVDVGAWLNLGFETMFADESNENIQPDPASDISANMEPTIPNVENQESTEVIPDVGGASIEQSEDEKKIYEPTEEDLAWLNAQMAAIVQPCFACLEEDPPRETPSVGEYQGLVYCDEHLQGKHHLTSRELVDHPLVQAVSKQFEASEISVMPCSDWTDERKEQALRDFRASQVNWSLKRGPIQQHMVEQWIEQGPGYTGLNYEFGAYWREQSTFDPTKAVDWTKHGYGRGKDGRWHATSSDYWTDNGYIQKNGRWCLPEPEVDA